MDEPLRDAACDRDGRVDRQVGEHASPTQARAARAGCLRWPSTGGRRLRPPTSCGGRFPIQPAEVKRLKLRSVHEGRIILAARRRRRRSGPRRACGSRTAGRLHSIRRATGASSTNAATGAPSACAASRLSVAAPTANRSCAVAGRSASAPSSAARCGSGICSRAPSAGRSSSSRPANGTRASDSIPRARRTRMPAAPACSARVFEQRRLADPDLAGQDDHGASVQPGVGESGVEGMPLRVATQQHAPILRRPPCQRGSRDQGGHPRRLRARRPTFGRNRPKEEHAMATIEQAPLDMEKLEAFVFRAVDEVGATLNTALVVMGDRLGLYRALAGAGPLTPVGARRPHGHGGAVRPRVAERTGRGRLRRVRPRERPLHAPAGAGARADRRGQPGVPARVLPDRPRFGDRFAPHHRGRRDRRGRRLARAQPQRLRGLRAVLPPGIQRQPARLVAAGARRRRRQARAGSVGRRRRLRARLVDDPDGEGVPELDLRRLRLPRRLDRDRTGAGARRPAPATRRFEVAPAASFGGAKYDFVTMFDCLHDMGDPVRRRPARPRRHSPPTGRG